MALIPTAVGSILHWKLYFLCTICCDHNSIDIIMIVVWTMGEANSFLALGILFALYH